jgi:DNA polymerase (family 10)
VTRAGAHTLNRAWDICDRLTASITATCPEIAALVPAGDLRRAEPLITSIVLVGSAGDPANAIRAIASLLGSANVRKRSERQLTAVVERARVEIRITSHETYGNELFLATGSAAHVDAITRRGLPDRAFATETELYGSVGLPAIPPELRHDTGEIEAAAARRLPALLEVRDMRGDLHMHTVYSDGRDPVETMIAGCHALGYEYIALTDHSAGSMAARTLDHDEIAQQRDEIGALRAKYTGLTILHGVEVDILADGRLDFSDETLANFDIVLASLHEHHGHDARRLTERSLAAIRHPLVNILCHPANRLVGHSAGYALDFDALYAAAVEHGTALEIDGAPMHMDLDGEHARAAAAAGVTLAVDSDCHRVEALGRQMRFGVGTARRAWVGPESVLNTRPLADILTFIAKRHGRRSA